MFNEERFKEYSEREFESVDNGIKLSMILKDIARLERVVLDREDIEAGIRQIKEKVAAKEAKNDSTGDASVSDKTIR